MRVFNPLKLLKVHANIHNNILKPWIHSIGCVKEIHLLDAKISCAHNSINGSRKLTQQISKGCTSLSVRRGVLSRHHFIAQISNDAFEFQKLRTDVEESFRVQDCDEELVHGIGVGSNGKTLVYPFLNPERRLQNGEGDKIISEKEIASINKTQTGLRVPSVTAILKKTMPIQNFLALKRWKEKMIKQMGTEAFEKHTQEMLSQGKRHHTNIEAILSGTPESELTINAEVAGYWKSMKHILADTKQAECLEHKTIHPHLEYCGYVDCVAKYKDQLCVIEWKTSRRRRPTLKQCYDYPLQAVAYAGALNYDANFKHEVSQTLLVIAYEDGKPADVLPMSLNDCESYWSEWLTRILKYRDLLKK